MKNVFYWFAFSSLGLFIATAFASALLSWQVILVDFLVDLPPKDHWVESAESIGTASGFASLIFSIFGFFVVLATFIWQCNESIKSQKESMAVMKKLNEAVETFTKIAESSKSEVQIEAITASLNAINHSLSEYKGSSYPAETEEKIKSWKKQREELRIKLVTLCDHQLKSTATPS